MFEYKGFNVPFQAQGLWNIVGRQVGNVGNGFHVSAAIWGEGAGQATGFLFSWK